MIYRAFFDVRIQHPYFTDTVPGLIYIPTEQTRVLLRNHQLLVRDTGHGLRILVAVDEQNNIIPQFGAQDGLVFNVFPATNTFLQHTDLSALQGGGVVHYTNEGLPAGDQTLRSSITLGNGRTWLGFPQIAEISVLLALLETDFNQLPVYSAVFNTKAVTWRYYLVVDTAGVEADDNDHQLFIQDSTNDLTFQQVAITEDTVDPIVTGLQANFVNAEVILFESEAPVASRDKARKNIQLLRQSDGENASAEVIMRHLPNPAPYDQGVKIINILM